LAPAHPPPPVKKLDMRHTGRLRKKVNLMTGDGGGGERGAKSYDGEKAWSSINHSIFSACKPLEGGRGGGAGDLRLWSRVPVPRKYVLFFHRLSILERATDHGCINNCSYPKRNVGRIQVQWPCEFFLREEVFQT
jgi:hypothetical protein